VCIKSKYRKIASSMQQLSCKKCSQHYTVDEAHRTFLDTVAPRSEGQILSIPSPTLCPSCRLQRRLAYRNPSTISWRTSSMSGKKIITAFTDESRAKVIENELWWGDSWSASDYARAYDFTDGFFSQFEKLRFDVPYQARLLRSSENSEYCHNGDDMKDCYFVFNTHEAEHSMYCDYNWWGKSNIDCTRTVRAELCYDCLETPGGYNLQSSEFSSDCRDSYFLSQCISCSNCFGCVNLVRKQFCIFNKQYSEVEYHNFIATLDLSRYSVRVHYQAAWEALKKDAPRPHLYGRRLEECSGNYLQDSARVRDSFYIIGGEDLRYCFSLNHNIKNCYDYSHFGNSAENIYECQSVGVNVFQLLFCKDCWNGCSDLLYCASCFGCTNCFGCVGLRNQHHCIFNKQYSKSEYFELLPRIIAAMKSRGEWGEFFPLEHSPFPYNCSFAFRYFPPYNKAEALQQGLSWYDREEVSIHNALNADELPDGLPASDAPLIVLSSQSGRPFRITAEEIKRYRDLKIPLPRMSYQERMEDRWARLGGITLHERRSSLTEQKVLTTLNETIAPVIWSREEWEGEML
jgi:hypothetical protein